MSGLFGWLSGRKRRSTSSAAGWQGQRTTTTLIAGRRYRADISYLLAKDALENDRLNFQHHFLHALLGDHFATPLTNAKTILDVGCGTGLWMIDMARRFPLAQLTGLDIEAPTMQLPLRCGFVQANLLQGLPFPEASFDFVHQRLLVAAIPAQMWPFVIKELVRVTQPGGWLELVEGGDGFRHPGPATQQFLTWFRSISQARGIDVAAVRQLDGLLREAGVSRVKKIVVPVPVGAWGGKVGDFMGKNLWAGWKGFEGVVCSQLSVSPEEFDATMKALPTEWQQRQTTYEYYVFFGQK